MTDETQESRTLSIGAKVTPSEKDAIDMVARVEKTSVSELLRPTIDELTTRGEKYMARLRELEPAA